MRVVERSLRAELPELGEVRSPPPPDAAPEELRLWPRAERTEDRTPAWLVPPPAPTASGLTALAGALDRLGSEELDAEALTLVDAAARAELAPRLAAVREMAQVLETLLGLRREAMARLRAQGAG